MFSRIYFLILSNSFLSTPSFLPPSIVFISMSNCFPTSSLISEINGVTVLFNVTGASILDFNVLTIVTILFMAVFKISELKTFASNAFLYFVIPFASPAVSNSKSASSPDINSFTELTPPTSTSIDDVLNCFLYLFATSPILFLSPNWLPKINPPKLLLTSGLNFNNAASNKRSFTSSINVSTLIP